MSIALLARYHPEFHRDPRTDAWHGAGWTAWDLVRAARARFETHHQPRVPAWGCGDEADPAVMAMKIAAAAEHGITAFLFDWHQDQAGPYVQGALERGYVRASNRRLLPYCLRWANSDRFAIHPWLVGGAEPALLTSGALDHAGFTAFADLVATHTARPEYWRWQGRPYLAIADLPSLVRGLGGLVPTREALDALRERVRSSCGAPPYLVGTVWGDIPLPDGGVEDARSFLRFCGFDAVATGPWVHQAAFTDWPFCDYGAAWRSYLQYVQGAAERFAVPLLPELTVGWDPSPRCAADGPWYPCGYPATPLYGNDEPEVFYRVCAELRFLLDSRPPEQQVCTINSWNGWLDGMVLEPDARHGMARLQALAEVFRE